MKITYEEIKAAGRIRETYDGVVGGSFCIDTEGANDLDIIVSKDKWETTSFDFTELNIGELISDVTEVAGVYDVSAYELHSTHRIGNINILVYNPDFLPAIKAAVRDMKKNPGWFKTRDQRIKVHQHYKQVIRDMLDPEGYLEDGAY